MSCWLITATDLIPATLSHRLTYTLIFFLALTFSALTSLDSKEALCRLLLDLYWLR